MSEKSLDFYELLRDSFSYATSSWLRMSLSEGNEIEANNVLAGASYLFGKLFAKEEPGEALTKLLQEEQGSSFRPKDIAEAANRLRLAMAGDDFAKGNSPFRSYLTWVAKEEPIVLEAFKDKQGMLCLVTIDALVSIFPKDKQNDAVRISEMVFLNISNAFLLAYRGLYGPKMKELASSPFFIDIEDSFERIRGSILD